MRKNEESERNSGKGFVCWQCIKTITEPDKEISFFDQLEFVKEFLLLVEQAEC